MPSSSFSKTAEFDVVDDNNNGNINKQLGCCAHEDRAQNDEHRLRVYLLDCHRAVIFHNHPIIIHVRFRATLLSYTDTHSRSRTHRTRYNNHSLCLCRPLRGYKRTCIMYTRGARLLLQHAIDTQKRNWMSRTSNQNYCCIRSFDAVKEKRRARWLLACACVCVWQCLCDSRSQRRRMENSYSRKQVKQVAAKNCIVLIAFPNCRAQRLKRDIFHNFR